MESGWRVPGDINDFRGVWGLPLVIEGIDGLRVGGCYDGLVILSNDEGGALIAALAVGGFPAMMVLGFGLEYFFDPNSFGGWGPGIAVIGIVGTGGLLGIGGGVVFRRS